MNMTMVRKISLLERDIKNIMSMTDAPLLIKRCKVLIERCNSLRSYFINDIKVLEEHNSKIDSVKKLERDINRTIKTIEEFLPVDKRVYNNKY